MRYSFTTVMIHISQYPRNQSSEGGETQQQAYGASCSNQMSHTRSLNSFSPTSINYPQPRILYDISTHVQVSPPRNIGSRPSTAAIKPHGPISPLRLWKSTSQNQMKRTKTTCEASRKILYQQRRRNNHWPTNWATEKHSPSHSKNTRIFTS